MERVFYKLSSPVLFVGLPFSSKTSMFMPKPGPCISPAKTGRVGTPSIKHETISVPPLTEWINAFELSFFIHEFKSIRTKRRACRD